MLGNEAPSDFSYGLGILNNAHGYLHGSSSPPGWTQAGGPSWVDDFTFDVGTFPYL